MSTVYTRRDVLRRGAAVAAAGTMLPLVGRVGSAVGLTTPDPSTAERNRLVLIYLAGGNDGLNTVIPTADVAGAPRRSVYDQVRRGIRYRPGDLLRLERGDDADQSLGLHPRLRSVHSLYEEGRVAVVQGVDYPDHDYSHFTSTAIWQSGQPETAPDSGWIGRHLDRAGIGEGEIRGVSIADGLPLTLQGQNDQGTALSSVPLRFRDGSQPVHDARHRAIRAFAAHPEGELLRHLAGLNAAHTVDLVDSLAVETAPPRTQNPLTDALLTARVLLEGDYGCEVVHVHIGGFDNHAGQRLQHANLLQQLDAGIDTFLNGDRRIGVAPLDPDVASRTLVMTYSEFGRRLGQNGSQGTDHGAAAPVFLIGPSGGRLAGGLHGDHPDMGTKALPADNLSMTTDLRALYQTVLTEWLGDPDPGFSATLPGLFT